MTCRRDTYLRLLCHKVYVGKWPCYGCLFHHARVGYYDLLHLKEAGSFQIVCDLMIDCGICQWCPIASINRLCVRMSTFIFSFVQPRAVFKGCNGRDR